MLECLAQHCLIPGKTSIAESGKSFTLQPEEGISIRFFRIDRCTQCKNVCEHCKGCLGLPADSRACDAIVHAVRGDDPLHVLLFVELKGAEYEHALSQIRAVADAARKSLDHQWKEFFVLGLILTTGSAPRNRKTG